MYRHHGGGMTPGMALTMVGQQLANALSQKWQRKAHHDKMTGLGERLFPEVQGGDMPGYQEAESLLDAMIPHAPMSAPAPLDPSKMEDVPTYMEARESQLEAPAAAWAEKKNKSHTLLREMITSGNPELEKLALAQNPMFQAQKGPMVVGGSIYDPKTDSFKTPEKQRDPDERYQTVTIGDTTQYVDTWRVDENGRPVVLGEGEKGGKKNEVWLKSPDYPGLQQGFTRDEDSGRLTPMFTDDGMPAFREQRAAQQINIDTGDKAPLEGYKVFEKQMVDNIEADRMAVQRTEDIIGMFKPEYQTIWGKAIAAGAGILDRFIPLKGEAKTALGEFAQYQQSVNENMNLYIKMITGAQMSEAEAQRLSLAIANLTDSPAEFEYKLQRSYEILQRAQQEKEETLMYYADLKARGETNLTYAQAREFAEENASRSIRLGMKAEGIDWSENSEVGREHKRLKGTGYFGGGEANEPDDGWEQR